MIVMLLEGCDMGREKVKEPTASKVLFVTIEVVHAESWVEHQTNE